MNNRTKQHHAGARIKADRVAASRKAPYLSAKIGRELNDIFYQILMTSLKLDINAKTTKQFNASFMLFEMNLFEHDKYIQDFKKWSSQESFIDKFLHIFDRNLVDNKELKNLIISYAGIHVGIALIAHQTHHKLPTHDVADVSVFVEEALTAIHTYVAEQYKKDFSVVGMANIFNKLAAHNIAYQTKMTELDEKIQAVRNTFSQSIKPLYASALVDLKIKAKHVDVVSEQKTSDKKSGRKINRRKRRLAVIQEVIEQESVNLCLPAPILESTYSEFIKVTYKEKFIKLPMLKVKVSDEVEELFTHPLSDSGDGVEPKFKGVWDVRLQSKVAHFDGQVNPAPESYSARFFSAPYAILLGAAAGFVGGIILAPITGFSSLALSLAMMVVLAGVIGSLGYLGGNEIDKAVTEVRRSELNTGIMSTRSIAEKFDLKVESGLCAIKTKADKVKDVMVQARTQVSKLKFFDASGPAAMSTQRKQIPLRFQL